MLVKQRLLFVTPHLSTGGLPQYLLKQIETLREKFELFLIEYTNLSNDFTVQKTKILNLIDGGNFFSLDKDKAKILELINNINPNIIHFEEMPEYFCNSSISEAIYRKPRNYFIIETSHDSGFCIDNKVFFPDKFVMVSRYQYNKFLPLNLPIDLIEYPITSKNRPLRDLALKKLNLDPNFTHVLNVGLFSPRKNQKEIFEVAKKLPNIMFHFVGNMADNFSSYWKPLIKDKPNNCFIWGERKDTELFYSSMDIFYFSSRGKDGDKETNPLVIREALSHGIKILIRKLDVYLDMYDDCPNIHFLSNDFNYNVNLVQMLGGTNNLSILNNLITHKTEHKVEHKTTQLSVSFNYSENKIEFNFPGKSGQYKVVIKDSHSLLTIYWEIMNLISNYSYWTIPIQCINFGRETRFGGFLINIYTLKDELVFSSLLSLQNTKPIDDFKFQNAPIFDANWYNYYEFFYMNKYENFLPNNLDTVIDIGANCGVFLRFIQKQCNPNRIIAVEPNRFAFKALDADFKQFKNISLIEAALVDKDGEISLYSANSNSTISSILKEQTVNFTDFHKGATNYKVRATTYKSLLQHFNLTNKPIDLLKVDIEGAEYQVFSIIKDDDLKLIRFLILEIHHIPAKRNDVIFLINRLKRLGFSLETYDNRKNYLNIDTTNEFSGMILAKQS